MSTTHHHDHHDHQDHDQTEHNSSEHDTHTDTTDNPLTIPDNADLAHTRQRFSEKTTETHPPTDPDADPNITTPCIEWDACINQGYGRFWMQGASRRAHRVAYALEHGSIPDDKPCIHHRCRNTACVNPDHLEAVTRAANTRRARTRNRNYELTRTDRVKGGQSLQNARKIDADTAAEIRQEYRDTDATYTDLADAYEVSVQTIGNIVNKERKTDQINHD